MLQHWLTTLLKEADIGETNVTKQNAFQICCLVGVDCVII